MTNDDSGVSSIHQRSTNSIVCGCSLHRANTHRQKTERTMLPYILSLPALSLSKGRRAGYELPFE